MWAYLEYRKFTKTSPSTNHDWFVAHPPQCEDAKCRGACQTSHDAIEVKEFKAAILAQIPEKLSDGADNDIGMSVQELHYRVHGVLPCTREKFMKHLSELHGGGEIYSTIDEDHFVSTR